MQKAATPPSAHEHRATTNGDGRVIGGGRSTEGMKRRVSTRSSPSERSPGSCRFYHRGDGKAAASAKVRSGGGDER